jgi:hypothetical protein
VNYKKGIFRLMVVASVVVFCLGYVRDFSPAAFLYDPSGLELTARMASSELGDSECKKGSLSFREYADKQLKYEFEVSLPREPSSHFVPDLNCPFLASYAEILGPNIIKKNKILVADLTPQIITQNIASARYKALWKIFLERSYNGAERLLKLWLIFASLSGIYFVVRWITRGFKT